MKDTKLTYRGADIQLSELLAEHEKLEKAVKEHDPVITYRGASIHYSELHPETATDSAGRDPIITYRGASAHQSELHN